jgi:hypothetical protein
MHLSASEVVVSSRDLAWVDVGWRDEPGYSGFDLDLPLLFVDQMVVMAAQERAVVCAGGSAA